ncbi:nucleoid-associated protein [Vibrio harveyi]|nr:nucleoid-associated protein [Vibrio harveyi]
MSTTRPMVITEPMRNSIEIHNFIYHILLKKNQGVDFLSEVSLTEDQKEFFSNMIAEASRGTKYDFIDLERGNLAINCKSILDNQTNDNFVSQSEKIAVDFKAQHDKRMSDGIVVVTSFSMIVNTERKRFVAILKLDYQAVLQQVRDVTDPTKVSFQQITESLIEDRTAIQKRAIVNIGDTFNWNVIAVERTKSVAKQDTDLAIGDHFQKFLNVKLKESNSSTTRKVITHAAQWATKQEGLVATDVKSRVINFLEANDERNINLDQVRDLICESDDEERSALLKESFDGYMDDVNLSGAQFTARANSIPKSERKFALKTNKNVTISWEGEMSKAGIKKEVTGQTVTITITANKVDVID